MPTSSSRKIAPSSPRKCSDSSCPISPSSDGPSSAPTEISSEDGRKLQAFGDLRSEPGGEEQREEPEEEFHAG